MAPDAALKDILELIDRHGWAVVGVGSGACSCPGCDGGADDGIEFSYTVGLTTLGFPEVIAYGLPQRIAQPCLNLIGDRVRSGRAPRVGAIVERVFASCRGYLLGVTDASDLVVADQIYPEFAAAQLIWPDPAGRFPWQHGYDRRRWPQPLMGPAPSHRPAHGTMRRHVGLAGRE